MMNVMKTPQSIPPAIKRFKEFSRICLEQGYTLPQLALFIAEEMERTISPAERVYAGICKSKFVEINIKPYQTHKMVGNDDDISTGHF